MKIVKDAYLAILNFIVPYIPFHTIRILIYRLLKVNIGKDTTILRPVFSTIHLRLQ